MRIEIIESVDGSFIVERGPNLGCGDTKEAAKEVAEGWMRETGTKPLGDWFVDESGNLCCEMAMPAVITRRRRPPPFGQREIDYIRKLREDGLAWADVAANVSEMIGVEMSPANVAQRARYLI